MKYYPVYLDLKNRPVLLIGAGAIAAQKIKALLDNEARIHVVAPDGLPEIQELSKDGKISWSKRGYESSDLEDAVLVIAATDDSDLQKRVAAEARQRHIWVNVVDVPPLCDFIAPAIVARGDIQIAISTGGAAPALAKHLRQKLEGLLGQEYADFVDIVQKLRPEILKKPKPQRDAFWAKAVDENFFKELREKGTTWAEKQLKDWMNVS